MPHTKLEVCGVLLIVYGAGDILGALVMLLIALFGEALGVSDILRSYFSAPSAVVTLVFLLSALYDAVLAVVDLMAGINGLRFCGGKCDIKLCRVPAFVVIVVLAVNFVLKMLGGEFAVSLVVHIVITVLCIVFAGKVEQYNLTRPAVEDTLVFNLKDGY